MPMRGNTAGSLGLVRPGSNMSLLRPQTGASKTATVKILRQSMGLGAKLSTAERYEDFYDEGSHN
mgnify:CR=1 FL=1